MKIIRNALFGLAFLGLALTATTGVANAGMFRHCQVINFGGFHYRWCQARFRPGPPWRRHRRWWRHHRHFRRCYVRITPWGRVRRCERW